MPGWLDQVTVADVVLALGGVGVLVFISRFVLVHVHPLMVKVTRVLDLILGRPEQQGIPGEPSMMQRFDVLDTRMDAQDEAIGAIKAEVTPNHGSSAHDKIARRVEQVEAKVDSILAHLEIPPE